MRRQIMSTMYNNNNKNNDLFKEPLELLAPDFFFTLDSMFRTDQTLSSGRVKNLNK